MASALLLNLSVFLAISTLGVALLLAGVSVLSYRRLRNVNLLVVGAAFVVLAVKGAVHAVRSVVEREVVVVEAGLDFLVLILLYVSVARR